MNARIMCMAVAAAGLMVAGCDEKKVDKTGAAATGAMKDMATKGTDMAKDAAGKMADGVKGLLAGNQEGAVKFFNDNLATAKTTIEGWASKIEALPAPAKATVEPIYKDLKEKVASFETSLGGLKSATGDGWKGVTEKLFKDWGDISGLMDKVKGMVK